MHTHISGDPPKVTTVQAVATAFAKAIIGARSTCDPPLCDTSNEVLTSAIETVLARATASVFLEQCSDRVETFSTNVLVDDITTATAKSLSSIYANSTVIGGVCDYTLDIDATVET